MLMPPQPKIYHPLSTQAYVLHADRWRAVETAICQSPYGPYADNLRHVLHAMEGHFVFGYADGGDAPHKELELVPGALEDARTFLANTPHPQTIFGRNGYHCPFRVFRVFRSGVQPLR